MTRIIGDTTSGLSLTQATELGIGFVPQIIIFEEKSFRDDTELTVIHSLQCLNHPLSFRKLQLRHRHYIHQYLRNFKRTGKML